MLTHMRASLIPNLEQDALPLVVTCSILVWGPKVADGDWTINGRNNIGQHDVLGFAGENVTATDASLRADEPGAFECKQDLLKVRLGECGALGDVTHRRRTNLIAMQRQAEERPAGIIPSGRDAHNVTLTPTIGR